MVAQTPGCRARRSLRRRPGTKCQEWRKKKRSVPEGQDDCVGAAFDSITELSTCQHDLCRLTRENMITPSLRDGLLFLTIGVGAKEIFAPPSEPDGPISGIRLSSWWLTFKKIGMPQCVLALRRTSQPRRSRY